MRLGAVLPGFVVAAVLAAPLALPAGATTTPRTCGKVTVEEREYVIKTHLLTCSKGKPYATNYLRHGASPKGWHCTSYPRDSDRVHLPARRHETSWRSASDRELAPSPQRPRCCCSLAPAPASAHGFQQRANLPIPEWLFGWAAAVVLVVSFVALAVLWSKPVLEGGRPEAGRRIAGRARPGLAARAGRLRGDRRVPAGRDDLVGAGRGRGADGNNFAPTLRLHLVLGRPRAGSASSSATSSAPSTRGARSAASCSAAARRPYPERWGIWPAVAGDPRLRGAGAGVRRRHRAADARARRSIAYTAVTLAAMAVYGWEAWSERGEAFGVYFGLFSRIAPLEARDGAVRTRAAAVRRSRTSAGSPAPWRC